MIELKNISKSYTTGTFTQKALNKFSVSFRKHEFVAILGPSGSGKSTLLNILGGLDKYDSGDVIINGKSTKNFKDTDWDSYRNKCIGFVFQNYNLISHISILANVEMSMTLNGVSAKERKRKAIEVLDKVGLKDHMHKKPNELSGGQMQRVAIARALVNDPEIILADEPTGALDSVTSVQIMDLIREISKDKLVVMVTHNDKLAYTYASRIIELEDGELRSDSNPYEAKDKKDKFSIKKTSMSFLTALNLSFNNIKTKKGRTILTAFASSIGIIGIALILSLSNGFQKQIDKFEAETLSSLPIMISQSSMTMDKESMNQMQDMSNNKYDFPTEKKLYPYESVIENMTHVNKFTDSFMESIDNLDENLIAGISYTRTTALNILVKNNNTVKPLTRTNTVSSLNPLPIPRDVKNNSKTYMEMHYDILEGKLPTKYNELALVVNGNNGISKTILDMLGIDSTMESIDFSSLIGKEYKLILNDDYYLNNNGMYYPNVMNLNSLYDSENAVTLKITGIIRLSEDSRIGMLSEGLSYTEDLVNYVIDKNKNSKIVLAQKNSDRNILTGAMFASDDDKNQIIGYLGADTYPVLINIYPLNFDSKDKVLNYIDEFNKDKADEDKIIYTDLASTISSLSSGIMDAITSVLIAFSAISLVVSTIMISIITYISVLERTKEIGILRAIGARKKDVSRVFNAETFIIGASSGLLGLLIARILIFPINNLLYKLTDLKGVAVLSIPHALLLLTISVLLTMLGGFIPAKMASKKDPVVALRTE